MKTNSIWISIVSECGSVVFARGCVSKEKAESVIVEYLKVNHKFNGTGFAEACCWIGENDLRLDLQVFEMERDDFVDIPFTSGLIVPPPPKEKFAFRVIYGIDVYARDVKTAAKAAYQLMIDPESMRPVLDIIDQEGCVTKVDLSEC